MIIALVQFLRARRVDRRQGGHQGSGQGAV